MKRLQTTMLATTLGLCLGACTSSSEREDGEDTASTVGDSDTGTDPTTGPTTAPTTSQADSSDGMGDDASSTGAAGGYDFDDATVDMLDQVDRIGMPAINTAVISSKDDYNQASPADDIAGTFVPEIVANLTGLHAALDDDLTGLGLQPCLVDDCVAQAAPLVVPDAIGIDPAGAAGFPNGRLPADPVVDVTLAVVLLDLTAPGQDAALFAGLPLNPPANDVAFEDGFPYLAAPH